MRALGEDGRVLRTLGRQGAGPGDSRAAARLGFLGDTLWVSDGGLRRVTMFPRGTARRPSLSTEGTGAPPDTGFRGCTVGRWSARRLRVYPPRGRRDRPRRLRTDSPVGSYGLGHRHVDGSVGPATRRRSAEPFSTWMAGSGSLGTASAREIRSGGWSSAEMVDLDSASACPGARASSKPSEIACGSG